MEAVVDELGLQLWLYILCKSASQRKLYLAQNTRAAQNTYTPGGT